MAVRIKDGMIPYTGGQGIEITNNHVINALLRELNNLIHVNDERELYVDLQLDDGIEPDDDFPVGVTTGKILQEDGRQQSGIILNWKTTSGDYNRIIYANDDKVYIDIGDGEWRVLGGGGVLLDINTKTFWIDDNQDFTTAQEAYEWYASGKNAILIHQGQWGYEMFSLTADLTSGNENDIIFSGAEEALVDTNQTRIYAPTIKLGVVDGTVTSIIFENWRECGFLDPHARYTSPFVPTEAGHPASKYYVDQELLKKQDVLTAGTRISITVDQQTGNTIISADVSGVLTYRGNVNSISDLPVSGTVGDTYFVVGADAMYSWDGTQWNLVGDTGIDLTNYFNKLTDDSDDIIQGSSHLFVTQTEKNTWNGKQDQIIAGNNITINADGKTINSTPYQGGTGITVSGHTINNTAPFGPENAGTMGQVLQKTNDGYKWVTQNFVTSVNGRTGAVTVNEFLPETQGTVGQILQKTATGYSWMNNTATQYYGGAGININQTTREISNALPFNPTNTGTAGQVIKLNSDGTYSWQDDNTGGGGGGGGGTTYYGGEYITIDSSHRINNTAPFIPAQGGDAGQVLTKTSSGYKWDDIELPSGENNVKFWSLNSDSVTTAVLQEIYQWVNADPNNGAIINDTYTNDVYVYNKINSTGAYPIAVFFGVKRNSAIREWTTSNTSHGYYTVQWQDELDIITGPTWRMEIRENPDDDTHTNYISALGANYPSPFMPTDGTQPATKAYVDSLIPGGTSAITNNTTGTTYTISQEWVGTQAQYDLITPVNGVIYNIIPSS